MMTGPAVIGPAKRTSSCIRGEGRSALASSSPTVRGWEAQQDRPAAWRGYRVPSRPDGNRRARNRGIVITTSGSRDTNSYPTPAVTVARLFYDRVAATPESEAFRFPTNGGWASVTWGQTEETVIPTLRWSHLLHGRSQGLRAVDGLDPRIGRHRSCGV